MQCFQRLQSFQAISFDLDDTLYNNQPIIQAAEQAMQQWLHQHFPASVQWCFADWRQCKLQLFAREPALMHDTSAARVAMLQAGLQQLGYSAQQATSGAAEGLAYFSSCRSDFTVPSKVVSLLKQLQHHYRLIGVTNGNVDHQRIGLGDVLEFVLHPGQGIRMKPHADMFTQAEQKLALPLAQLLHVGDHPVTDVEGARRAGAQAIWLAPAYGQQTVKPLGTLLPHWRIEHISQLATLLLR